MSNWRCVKTDELTHHGIKGQKWGRRRYQNADGSLTPAGKQRYNDGGEAPKWTEKLPTFKEMAEMKKNDPKKYERYKAWEANQDFHKNMEKMTKEQDDRLQKEYAAKAKDEKKAKMQERMTPERLQNDIKTAKGLYDKAAPLLKDKARESERKALNEKITTDLSKMSDDELKQVVNRLNLEERYSQVMNSRYANQGKNATEKFLDTIGTVLTVGGSAVSLAVAMQQLKKK